MLSRSVCFIQLSATLLSKRKPLWHTGCLKRWALRVPQITTFCVRLTQMPCGHLAALRSLAIKPWELTSTSFLSLSLYGMCETCCFSLGLGAQAGREKEGAGEGRELCFTRQPAAPPTTRPVSIAVFLCELKRGVLGSWFRLGKNSWHGCNWAGNRKQCHEVTNRKRWWQHNAASLGSNSRKALLRREGRWREWCLPLRAHIPLFGLPRCCLHWAAI